MIKYELELKRVAQIRTPAGMIDVGEVVEFYNLGSGARVTVKLYPDVQNQLKDKIEEDPSCLTIAIAKQIITSKVIIPDDGIIS